MDGALVGRALSALRREIGQVEDDERVEAGFRSGGEGEVWLGEVVDDFGCWE